jgi:hypothetical protein
VTGISLDSEPSAGRSTARTDLIFRPSTIGFSLALDISGEVRGRCTAKYCFAVSAIRPAIEVVIPADDSAIAASKAGLRCKRCCISRYVEVRAVAMASLATCGTISFRDTVQRGYIFPWDWRALKLG